MAAVNIKTGDILQWAEKMEERGAEFAAEVVKKAKRGHEQRRKNRQVKFARIRRRKSGQKRFAIVKDSNRAAELISRSASAHFTDIFKK